MGMIWWMIGSNVSECTLPLSSLHHKSWKSNDNREADDDHDCPLPSSSCFHQLQAVMLPHYSRVRHSLLPTCRRLPCNVRDKFTTSLWQDRNFLVSLQWLVKFSADWLMPVVWCSWAIHIKPKRHDLSRACLARERPSGHVEMVSRARKACDFLAMLETSPQLPCDKFTSSCHQLVMKSAKSE